MTFNALVLDQADDKVSAAVTELTDDRLPAGDVTVDVTYPDGTRDTLKRS